MGKITNIIVSLLVISSLFLGYKVYSLGKRLNETNLVLSQRVEPTLAQVVKFLTEAVNANQPK